MPTPFSHIWAAIAISPLFYNRTAIGKLLLLGMICTIVPDIDVLGFKLGVPYGHFFGHRGFTHSITFSVLFAALICFIFYGKYRSQYGMFIALFLYFFACTVSHALLDAMTSGGKGVALLSPFDNDRIFLPWRPIQVAPMSWSGLMTEWGKRVMYSEFKWIWIPGILLTILMLFFRKK